MLRRKTWDGVSCQSCGLLMSLHFYSVHNNLRSCDRLSVSTSNFNNIAGKKSQIWLFDPKMPTDNRALLNDFSLLLFAFDSCCYRRTADIQNRDHKVEYTLLCCEARLQQKLRLLNASANWQLHHYPSNSNLVSFLPIRLYSSVSPSPEWRNTITITKPCSPLAS